MNIGISEVFLIWLLVYLFLWAIKLLFWSPVHMKPQIVEDDEYSLFEHSYLITCFSKSTDFKVRSSTKVTYSLVLRDFNYYLAALGLSIYQIRRQTYNA